MFSFIRHVPLTIVLTASFSASPAAELLHYYDFENGYDDLAGGANGTAGSEVEGTDGFDDGEAAFFPGNLSTGGPFDQEGYLNLDPVISGVDGDFSFSYWVKLEADDATTDPRGIFDFSGDGGDGPQSLFIQQGANADKMAFRVDGTGTSFALALIDVPEDASWFFVTATFSPGGELLVYLDGNLEATIDAGSVTEVIWDFQQYIGAFNVNGLAAARGTNGAVDDFAIYSGILTPAEVSGLVNQTLSPADFGLIQGNFSVTGITVTDTEATVTFTSRTGREYRIFGGDELSDPANWDEATAAPLPGTGESLSVPLSLTPGSPRFFYQVREFPLTKP